MMQAMKGATGVLGSMNRNMNLPALQRIAMEFEKENDIMDQRQEMMDDAIDDVTGLEDEAEGDEIVDQVLEEIGVDLKNAVSCKLEVWLKYLLTNNLDGRDTTRSSRHRCIRGQSSTSYWRRRRRRWWCRRSWRQRPTSKTRRSAKITWVYGVLLVSSGGVIRMLIISLVYTALSIPLKYPDLPCASATDYAYIDVEILTFFMTSILIRGRDSDN
jgi:hypothetical protein